MDTSSSQNGQGNKTDEQIVDVTEYILGVSKLQGKNLTPRQWVKIIRGFVSKVKPSLKYAPIFRNVLPFTNEMDSNNIRNGFILGFFSHLRSGKIERSVLNNPLALENIWQDQIKLAFLLENKNRMVQFHMVVTTKEVNDRGESLRFCLTMEGEIIILSCEDRRTVLPGDKRGESVGFIRDIEVVVGDARLAEVVEKYPQICQDFILTVDAALEHSEKMKEDYLVSIRASRTYIAEVLSKVNLGKALDQFGGVSF